MSWEIVSLVLGVVLGVSGIAGVFYANSKNVQLKTQDENNRRTIETYKELVAVQDEKMNSLSAEIRDLRESHTENVKLIGQLQGELKSWKELPIKELAANIKYVTELQYLMAQHMGMKDLPTHKQNGEQ